jgi:hypothetical protein
MKGLGTDHIVDSHASRIRAKIREYGGPEVIAVIRSVGFRIADLLPSEVQDHLIILKSSHIIDR